MSTVVNLPDARLRGIDLPSDDVVAQDLLDEQEAWLARRIGQLTGERTETFLVGFSTAGKLALRRYTDSVVVTDAGSTVAAGYFRLIDNGAAIERTYSYSPQWWVGPYVTATYTPNDLLEVQRAIYDLAALAAEPASALDSEDLGDYAYTRGIGVRSIGVKRSAVATSLLPKRDPLLSVPILSRRLGDDDAVINRTEPWT